MLIRREAPGDVPAIRHIHGAAFASAAGGAEPVEVRLVDQLRASDAWIPQLSIVAEINGETVGHVVCSRAWIEPMNLAVLGLAPIGVLPDHQGVGIGQALMHAVLGAADALDEPLVGLVGEPDYYARFGFCPARTLGLEAPDPAWGDFFQARSLTRYESVGAGRFHYAPPFGSF